MRLAPHTNPTSKEPPGPSLTFLYTSYVDCLNGIYGTQGPRGIRTAIPIVGGNFTGPRLSGKILDVGADWGVTDVQTGIFSADTRYNLQTYDGANLFSQTSGPSQPKGGLHLRVVIETGDKNYYWLNNIIGTADCMLYAHTADISERLVFLALSGPVIPGSPCVLMFGM
ncbi:hypothetical protein LTR85_008150 [Meristemomyces frigidus]|nr:hypothetical protein LTR85_008150 [Meristemomyces frigidus]